MKFDAPAKLVVWRNNGLHHSTIEISFTMLSFDPDLKSSNILTLFVNKRE